MEYLVFSPVSSANPNHTALPTANTAHATVTDPSPVLQPGAGTQATLDFTESFSAFVSRIRSCDRPTIKSLVLDTYHLYLCWPIPKPTNVTLGRFIDKTISGTIQRIRELMS